MQAAPGAFVSHRYRIIRALEGRAAQTYLARDELWDREVELVRLDAGGPEQIAPARAALDALSAEFHVDVANVYDVVPDRSRGGASLYYATEVATKSLAALTPAEVEGRAAALPRESDADRETRALGELIGALARQTDAPRALWIAGPRRASRALLARELRWAAELLADVVVGNTRGPSTVASMVRRALGATEDVEAGLEGALRAMERVGDRARPLLFVVDDADLLADEERIVLLGVARSLDPRGRVGLVCIDRHAETLEGAGRVIEIARTPRTPVRAMNALDVATRLGGEERATLALVALEGGALDDGALAELGVRRESIARLVSAGALVRRDAILELPDAEHAPVYADALAEDQRAGLHRRLAERLRAARDTRASAVARLTVHLASALELDQAEELLVTHRAVYERDPNGWARAVEAVAARRPSASVLLAAAEIHEIGGEPSLALDALARLLRTRPKGALLAQARHRIGSACYARGDLSRAIRYLGLALASAESDAARAVTAEVLSRAQIKRGAYAEALDTAREAIAWTSDATVLGDLEDDAGVAAGHVGDGAAARSHFDRAAELHAQASRPRAQVRSYSLVALNEYRLGNVEAAAEGYRRALEIAETHGLSDHIANAALNLGTACHQRGDWGHALTAYERGLRSAIALGKTSTTATLRFDLAKLYADIGLFERATAAAKCAREAAAAAGMSVLLAATESVQGEIALGAGDFERAQQCFERARQELAALAARREVAEVDLNLAEAALAAGRPGEALGALERAETSARALVARETLARAAMLRALVQVQRGDLTDAIDRLEAALRVAREIAQRTLEADIEGVLAEVCDRQGAGFLAQQHRSRSRALWDDVARSLAADLRAMFWRHRRRARVARAEEPAAASHAPGGVEQAKRLRRVLGLHKKLYASLEPDDVVSALLDVAIELTGAERGFIVLDTQGSLEACATRNVEPARIDRRAAEQVMRTGEPVVRAEGHTAAHPRSRACMPIRAPRAGVLGAVYLDSGFHGHGFEQDDVSDLAALIDQGGVALMHARRARELETAVTRLEARAAEQSAEVERLRRQTDARQSALEARSDDRDIVGRGRAMRRVLRTLDRVVGTGASVLVRGESGSGKELFARAIHFNGPHAGGPFIALDCTALEQRASGADLVAAIERARGGTLFVEEIAAMPLGLQAALARALGSRGAPRLVAATGHDLGDDVAVGRLREDLYHRVAAVEIVLPPLRERLEDIEPLAKHLVGRIAKDHGRPVPELERAALRRLMRYDWPGNVRQLESVLTKAVLFARGPRIRETDLDLAANAPVRVRDRSRSRRDFEREDAARILAALRASRWNVSEVSRALGIPRATLYRKLERYGIAPKR